MNFSIQRETLLKPLQMVTGVVEKRQTLPILSNVLLRLGDGKLSVTGTDLEVELESFTNLLDSPDSTMEHGHITVPGRKLLDICRTLPEQAMLECIVQKEKMIIRSDRSRFTLSTLPSSDFPTIESQETEHQLMIPQKELLNLAQRSAFAMAQQDVRYYLNGMLLELKEGTIRTVATDGHRLAINATPAPVVNNDFIKVILPRKGVSELIRLLKPENEEIKIALNHRHIRVLGNQFVFTSKLIEGSFPDYERVVPKQGDKAIIIDKNQLKKALARVAILSNEKVHGVRFQLGNNLLRIISENPEGEKAEEELHVDCPYSFEIGFNVYYLLDVLNTTTSDHIKLSLNTPDTSALIEPHDSDTDSLFVLMPMRL